MSAFNLPPECRLTDLEPRIKDENWFWEEVDRRREQIVDEELSAQEAQNGELVPTGI